jgi:hypothetical protein
MVVDHLPAGLKPLIQPIHTWFENKKLGLAYEARSESGNLLVCSVDMQKNMEERPVSRQLLFSILSYMNSDAFNPEMEIPFEDISVMVE